MFELGKITPRSTIQPFVFSGLICLFFITTLVLLLTGNYVKKEEVPGHIQTRDIARVISDHAAHINEVLVATGEKVRKGQPLIRMRAIPQENVSEGSETTSFSQSAERLARLLANRLADEAYAQSAHDAQQRLLHLQREQVLANLQLNRTLQKSLQRRAKIAMEQKQRHERLAEQGAVSHSDLDQAIVNNETALQDLANNELARTSAQQRILELEQASNEATHTLARHLSELARQEHQLREQLQKLHKTQEYVLLAPVDGVVDTISVFPGSRTDAGQPLLLLRTHHDAPKAPLVILEVSPSAIGFARVGTEVIVRIDAFPYAHYGVIKGVIVHSTATTYLNRTFGGNSDSVPPGQRYLVEVKLDFSSRTRIQQGWLKDGMTLNASLSLERLSLMQWLFLPVLKGTERNPDFFLAPPKDGLST